MTREPCTISIDDLLKGTLVPELKKAGFRKQRLCWNRDRKPFVDVLTVQLGKGSDSENLQLAINAGVFVPQFYEMVWGRSAQGMVPDADCALRIRVGPVAGGEWWNVNTSTEIPTLQAEMNSQCSAVAFSFWDEYRSLHDVYRSLRNLGDWKQQYWLVQLYTAIAAHLTGNSDLVGVVLHDLCQSKNASLAEKAKAVSAALLETKVN
jgi:hypothetical protein